MTRRLWPLAVAVAVLLALPGVALAWIFGANPINLTSVVDPKDAGYPVIAVSQDGQNIGIAWTERRPGGGTIQGPIYLKMAHDGQTIDRKIRVDAADSSALLDESFDAKIASDPITPTDMHLVWTNLNLANSYSPQYASVYYARCQTTGVACNRQVLQSANNNALQSVEMPGLATSKLGNTTIIHAVWVYMNGQTNPRQRAVFYTGRAANGTWSTPISISSVTEWANHPVIATATGSDGQAHIYVAWASDTDRDNNTEVIRYRRGSVDPATGLVTSWGSASGLYLRQTYPYQAADMPDFPTMAAIADTVMLAWDEVYTTPWPADEQYFLAYAVSNDQGVTFSTPENMFDPNSPFYSDYFRFDSEPDLGASDTTKRLQPHLSVASTPIFTGQFSLVFHQTIHTPTPYHDDVFYASYAVCDLSYPDCGAIGFAWLGVFNETANKKLPTHDNAVFSFKPAIASAGSQQYVVYMEGTNPGGYHLDWNDFDVVYNGTVVLTDTTRSGGVYLPVILKNK